MSVLSLTGLSGVHAQDCTYWAQGYVWECDCNLDGISVLVQKMLDEADAAIAAIDAENAQFESDWVKKTNGTYRNNKSRDYRDYYQKRVFVALWDKKNAFVQFAPDQPLRWIRRTHLTID